MSATALALVLIGAICHAGWNVVAKKAGGGLVFVWLFGLVSIVVAAPVAFCTLITTPQHSMAGCGLPHSEVDSCMWSIP